MALTFYTNPLSRGRLARWALEEAGEPYEEVILGFGPPMRTPEYLAINPMAKVPALVHDGSVITEVGAIVAHLADAFPASGMMPADRGAFFRWMFFGAGPLEYALVNASMGFEVPRDQEGRMGYGSLDRTLGALKAQLAKGPWLCGESWSGADLYVGSQVGFAMERSGLARDEALADWAARARDRPAAARAAEKDGALIAAMQASQGAPRG